MTTIDGAGVCLPADDPGDIAGSARAPRFFYRHRLWARAWHWTNAVALIIMLMSGLMIFNAHPRLYWGSYGANMDTPWLQIGPTATGGHVVIGSGIDIPTGGVLGRSTNKHGGVDTHAFPWWSTIPSGYNLAGARRWHLAFAWILALSSLFYLIVGFVTRHITRDILPTRDELKPSNIKHDIVAHAKLQFPTGEDATHYHVLQKLSYGAVVLVLIPLIILTGMTMSPAFDANFPLLLSVFGGRQSARSIHFLCAFGLLAFTVVHLLMVMLAGPIDEVRSMVTGWFRIPEPRNGR